MSEWTPKVGDKVMVGEHGPYSVVWMHGSDDYCQIREVFGSNDPKFFAQLPIDWLSPAPEPEPDEPTAPGALVRDGEGDILARLEYPRGYRRYEWVYLTGCAKYDTASWGDIIRPVTVVLADPAEVETLRAERDELKAEVESLSGLNTALIDARDHALRLLDERRGR